MARRLIIALLTVSLTGPAGLAHATTPPCTGTLEGYVSGVVTRTACHSDALGGDAAFSYFVPPQCTAASPCPTLYLLHGFGNDDREMVGTAAHPSDYILDLKTAYPVRRLSFVIVAPEGRTVEQTGACKDHPAAGEESFWVNWNPRYWPAGCAPRFEDHVIHELIPLVDRSLPVIATRAGRAILGVSLGGYGSFKLALQHPDVFANAGSISGALNILVAPDVQPLGPGMPGTGGAPASTTYVHLPHLIHTPPHFPYGDPFGAFGDPAADEAYYRGNGPLDLAIDAHATGTSCAAPAGDHNDGFCLPLRFFHNDTVPTHPKDLTDPRSLIGSEALEAAVMPMNQEMRLALKQDGIPFTYQLHPGTHSLEYWAPYIRAQLEWQYARVAHPGAPLTLNDPELFDYRSIDRDFSVWGWGAHVDRTPDEFLTLWNASRNGVTITGSGTVTVTTPAFGVTGVTVTGAKGPVSVTVAGGRATVTFTIGPSYPTDERVGASGIPEIDHTVRLCFTYGSTVPACAGT